MSEPLSARHPNSVPPRCQLTDIKVRLEPSRLSLKKPDQECSLSITTGRAIVKTSVCTRSIRRLYRAWELWPVLRSLTAIKFNSRPRQTHYHITGPNCPTLSLHCGRHVFSGGRSSPIALPAPFMNRSHHDPGSVKSGKLGQLPSPAGSPPMRTHSATDGTPLVPMTNIMNHAGPPATWALGGAVTVQVAP